MPTSAAQTADKVDGEDFVNDQALFSEVQPYRELPPVVFLCVISAVAGWGLLYWTAVLGRPIGALVLPPWLAIVTGLGFSVVIPALFFTARMTTQVFADRVKVNTGLSGTHTFDYRDVAAVEERTEDIRDDYNNRNVAEKENTRVAYTVSSLQGAQLTLQDGRFVLIGSKVPEELSRAIDTAWQAITITA